MKILKDDEYAALKTKADNYDAVVNGIVGAGENLSSEDITPQTILDAMTPSAGDGNQQEMSELREELQTVTEERNLLEQRAAEAEMRVSELENAAGEQTVQKTPPVDSAADESIDEVNNFIKSSNDFAEAVEKARKLL